MAPGKPRKKSSLDHQPIEGRLDALCYRLSESAVRMVEAKIGIGGLWDVIKDDVEEMVVENIGYTDNILSKSGFNILKNLLNAQRVKGRM